MKFAANIWIWTTDFAKNNYSVFDKIADIGFKGIELPVLNQDGNVSEINEKLKSCNLYPIVLGGGSEYADLSSDSHKIREAGIEYIVRCVKTASKLGSELVAGPLYCAVGKMKYLSKNDRRRELRLVAEGLRRAAKTAKDEGVKIAIEPLNRYDTYLINTVEDGLDLIRLAGNENLGLLLDTFHLNIEEKSPSDAVKLAGKRLFHIHAIETNRGPPGSGSFRWKDFAQAVTSAKYRRWISIESFTNSNKDFALKMKVWRPTYKSPDALAADGLRFLKKLLVR